MALMTPNPAAAKCRLFSVWHYPWKQRCYTALAPPQQLARREAGFAPVKETAPNRERIEISLPPKDIALPTLTDITWGETGPDELRGIALLRQLMETR